MSGEGRECQAAGGRRDHAVCPLQQFRYGMSRSRSVDPLRTDKVGACCNVGARQLRDLVSERGVGLPHDGTGRFGFGASLLAFAVLREDLIPERRQEGATVVAGCLGCCGDVGRHGEAAETSITIDYSSEPFLDEEEEFLCMQVSSWFVRSLNNFHDVEKPSTKLTRKDVQRIALARIRKLTSLR